MTNEMWLDIIKFHNKFGFEAPPTPTMLDDHTSAFRTEFLIEELKEYIEAETLEDKIDALVDLVVVAMGTAHFHGFDWDSHWNEVHEANMRKERTGDPSKSKRGSSLDITKPEGWKGPDHSKHL